MVLNIFQWRTVRMVLWALPCLCALIGEATLAAQGVGTVSGAFTRINQFCPAAPLG